MPIIGTRAGATRELLAGVVAYLSTQKTQRMQICQLSDAEWRAMSETALEKVISYNWEDASNLFEAALYAAVEFHAQLTNKA